MEYWSGGMLVLNPILHHSSTPVLQFILVEVCCEVTLPYDNRSHSYDFTRRLL